MKTEFFKHIGLYVYRRGSLLRFTDLQPTDLEKAEKQKRAPKLNATKQQQIAQKPSQTMEDQEALNYFCNFINRISN